MKGKRLKKRERGLDLRQHIPTNVRIYEPSENSKIRGDLNRIIDLIQKEQKINLWYYLFFFINNMVEKNKYSFVVDFFSGGLAGVIAKTISAPIERVKILLQTQRENNKIINKYNGIIDCFGRCVRDEGILSLWRGNGVNVIRYFPTQALNFSFKDFYGRYFNVRKCQDSQMHFLWMNIWCGGLAGSTTTLFVHPLDFVRTRLAVDMGKLKNER